jgi:hypothetical protein
LQYSQIGGQVWKWASWPLCAIFPLQTPFKPPQKAKKISALTRPCRQASRLPGLPYPPNLDQLRTLHDCLDIWTPSHSPPFSVHSPNTPPPLCKIPHLPHFWVAHGVARVNIIPPVLGVYGLATTSCVVTWPLGREPCPLAPPPPPCAH